MQMEATPLIAASHDGAMVWPILELVEPSPALIGENLVIVGRGGYLNTRSWFVNGRPLAPPMPGFTAEPALLISLVALSVWVAVLVGIAIVLFNRQDITA